MCCFCLSHEYSRAETFSLRGEASELSALDPVRVFDTSPKIADMLGSKLRSPICLL